jgi:hypothetical protein
MKKKRKTRLTPEFWRRDAEGKRALAERIAYGEILEEERGSWKDQLDPELRRRVEERADEILAETYGRRGPSAGE